MVCSHQNELLRLSELVDVGVDLSVGTNSSVGHHKKIDTSARRDVGEATDVVCCQGLDWNKDTSPAIEDCL